MPSRLTLEDAHAEAAKHGGRCLSDTYINSKSLLLWGCKVKEHRNWTACINNVRNGTWCPQCAGALTLEDAQAVAEERGGVCLSLEYKNSKTPLDFDCLVAGHPVFQATLNHVKCRGTWCARCGCANKNTPFRTLTLEDAQEAAAARGGTCLSTVYINSKTPMLFKCHDENHKPWATRLNNVRSGGTWCPHCDCSQLQLRCQLVAEAYLGPCQPDAWPRFLVTAETPKGLELDIYYPQYGLAIEAQGIRHRQELKYFHKTHGDFVRQQLRDRIKRRLCEDNSIILIEVWDTDNPEKTITAALNDLGLLPPASTPAEVKELSNESTVHVAQIIGDVKGLTGESSSRLASTSSSSNRK